MRILVYTVWLWFLTLVFAPIGDMGWIYWVAAVVLGAVFTAFAVQLLRDGTTKRAMRVFTFSNAVVEVPPRRGMAGVEAVIRSQPHQSTLLGKAVSRVNGLPHERLIVVTDEQSHDEVPDPKAAKAYMVNVASARNGVGYGRWTHVDGFSEVVLGFIREHELLMSEARQG